MLEKFKNQDFIIFDFFTALICGFCTQKQVELNGDLGSLSIISRKEVGRLGTRFFTRGLDRAGNAANSVETEMAFEHPYL